MPSEKARCRPGSGRSIYQRMAPGLVTPEVFERALGLMAGLYEEQ
jgi:hypothetical protein